MVGFWQILRRGLRALYANVDVVLMIGAGSGMSGVKDMDVAIDVGAVGVATARLVEVVFVQRGVAIIAGGIIPPPVPPAVARMGDIVLVTKTVLVLFSVVVFLLPLFVPEIPPPVPAPVGQTTFVMLPDSGNGKGRMWNSGRLDVGDTAGLAYVLEFEAIGIEADAVITTVEDCSGISIEGRGEGKGRASKSGALVNARVDAIAEVLVGYDEGAPPTGLGVIKIVTTSLVFSTGVGAKFVVTVICGLVGLGGRAGPKKPVKKLRTISPTSYWLMKSLRSLKKFLGSGLELRVTGRFVSAFRLMRRLVLELRI